MDYILPREAYIANTRNDTSGTSDDSDKLCNSFIQVHVQEVQPSGAKQFDWLTTHNGLNARVARSPESTVCDQKLEAGTAWERG